MLCCFPLMNDEGSDCDVLQYCMILCIRLHLTFDLIHFNFVIFQYTTILVEKFCHKGDMQSLKERVREINAYVVFSARMIQTVKWIQQEFKVFMTLWQWLVSFYTRGPENTTNTPEQGVDQFLLYQKLKEEGCTWESSRQDVKGQLLEKYWRISIQLLWGKYWEHSTWNSFVMWYL